MSTLKISYIGPHGFFSCCSVSLMRIIEYLEKNKKLPDIIDRKEIYTTFKINEQDDISSLFFIHNNPNITIEYSDEIIKYQQDMQFEIYNKLNYEVINPIIAKYFTLSEDILKIVSFIEQKYNIDYDNTCCVFYRGNDKITETNIPSYDIMLNKIKSLNLNVKQYLFQSDETEFLVYFNNIIKNNIIFKDEIIHISRRISSINHVTNDRNIKLKYIKQFLAIVYIMSKCKYVICTSGNISVWITYFRGNSINVYQYLHNSWC